MPEQGDSSEFVGHHLCAGRRFHRPSQLIAAVLREDQDKVEAVLGPVAAGRMRTGHETVRDLILAAVWMGVSPTEMWPATPGRCL